MISRLRRNIICIVLLKKYFFLLQICKKIKQGYRWFWDTCLPDEEMRKKIEEKKKEEKKKEEKRRLGIVSYNENLIFYLTVTQHVEF